MFLRNAQDEIKIAELFLSVDSQRKNNDKFKLPSELRDILAERLAVLKTAENAVAPAKGNRTNAVGQTKDAVANLRQYLRADQVVAQAQGTFGVRERSGEHASRCSRAVGWSDGVRAQGRDARSRD